MEEFGTNPDIDEKPPMSLRAAIEKVKPFLMAYEGIQSQEEWEVYSIALKHGSWFMGFFFFLVSERGCISSI